MKNKQYIIAAGVAVVIGYLYYKNKAKKRNPYPTNLRPKADPVTGECPKGYEKVFPMSDMCFPIHNMLK